MVKKICVLLLIVTNIQGSLRGRGVFLLVDKPKPRVDSQCVTPVSPMAQVVSLQCLFPAKGMELGTSERRTSFDCFLESLDKNSPPGDRLSKHIRIGLLNARFVRDSCRETPVMRALKQGYMRSFAELIDAKADLTIPDSEMMTVAMYVAVYRAKDRDLPARILADRHIVLDRTVPYDKQRRNALWYLVNRKVQSWDKDLYDNVLIKIRVLREFGVSATDKDCKGRSALDCAQEIYGADSGVVRLLRDS